MPAAFNQEQLRALTGLRKQFLSQRPAQQSSVRSRFELVDRYIQRTQARMQEDAEGRAIARLGDRTKIRNYEVPLILEHLDTMHARLVGIFCTGQPMFPAIAINGDEQSGAVADMLSALVEQDQLKFNWARNVMLGLWDGLKYNRVAFECDWTQRKLSTVGMVVDGGKPTRGAVIDVASGNCIKRLDPYNFFYDTTVPFCSLATDGVYAGYVERMNYIGVKRYLQELPDIGKVTSNFSEAISKGTGSITGLYFIPEVRPLEPSQRKSDENWEAYFGIGSLNAKLGATGRYEKTVLYCRIIPSEYKMERVRAAGTPAIFKLVWIGDTLVYAENLRNAHNMLPIFTANLIDDGLGNDTQSYAENLMDTQDTSTSLLNASLNSMRRAVADRAIYNPLLIDGRNFEVNNPAPKIPLKPSAIAQPMDQAYKQIPYVDNISGLLVNNMQLVRSMATNITGLNPASGGTFVPGNKTREEFAGVMNNSDARGQKLAYQLEASLFTPMKQALLYNYLQFAPAGKIMQASQQREVDIDPTKMLEHAADFGMADGLVPTAILMNTQAMSAAFNTLAQSPSLSIEYDTSAIFATLLRSQGVNVSKFRRSPEEIKQQQQYQLQMAAAQAGKQIPAAGQPDADAAQDQPGVA